MKTFIGHVDTLLNYNQESNYNFMAENNNFHLDYPRLKKGNIKIVTFAVYVESENKPDRALERTLQLIDRFYSLVEKTDNLFIIRNFNELESALNNEQIGVILGLEGAEAVFDLSALRILYRLGVRTFSLTWNQRNALADGIGELDANGGVTRLGKKVIEEANRLGMIIDVSHLSPASFWDVIKYSKKPVMASHSNAKSICSHPRNLDDEQLKALAKSGGYVGLNFEPSFIKDNGKAEIIDLIKHINYIRDLIGIDYITLGTDYDGILETPAGLEDVSKLPVLEEILLSNGYSKKEVKKIFIDNWLKFVTKISGG